MGKPGVVSFGAEQEAGLISSPDYE